MKISILMPPKKRERKLPTKQRKQVTDIVRVDHQPKPPTQRVFVLSQIWWKHCMLYSTAQV